MNYKIDVNNFVNSDEETKAEIFLNFLDLCDEPNWSDADPIITSYSNSVIFVDAICLAKHMSDIKAGNLLNGLTDRQIIFNMVNRKTINLDIDEEYFKSQLSTTKRKNKLNKI